MLQMKHMRHVPPIPLMDAIKVKCVGVRRCKLRPIRADLGVVAGMEHAEHALSVIVKCADELTWRENMSDKMIETYGYKCFHGCNTCMRSHEQKTRRLECHSDSLITDITDAVYGAKVRRARHIDLLPFGQTN